MKFVHLSFSTKCVVCIHCMYKCSIRMYIYGKKLSQLANQIAGILEITQTARKCESHSEIVKLAKMNTCAWALLERAVEVAKNIYYNDLSYP